MNMNKNTAAEQVWASTKTASNAMHKAAQATLGNGGNVDLYIEIMAASAAIARVRTLALELVSNEQKVGA